MKLSRVTCFIYYLGSTVFRASGGREVRVFFTVSSNLVRVSVGPSRVSCGGRVRNRKSGVGFREIWGVRRENREGREGRAEGGRRTTDRKEVAANRDCTYCR